MNNELFEASEWYRLNPDGTLTKMTEEELAAQRQRKPSLRISKVDWDTKTITLESIPEDPSDA